MNVGKSIFTLENINSDILFVKDNESETLSLMRMNYVIDNKNISNNKIVLSKDNKKEYKDIYKEEWKQGGQRISSSIWCKKV